MFIDITNNLTRWTPTKEPVTSENGRMKNLRNRPKAGKK
jgi:hypothetical protein